MPPPRSRDGSDSPFESHFDVIGQVIAIVSRQQHLRADEAEEFRSLVHLKLLEDDCAILRKFQHRSSLRTYLKIVVTRMLLDDRDARWGKWRPSMEAKRHGTLGILVERLIERDGLTMEQACEVLETNHGVTIGRARILEICARLRVRRRRRPVGEELLEGLPATGTDADRTITKQEHEAMRARAHAVLARVRAAMPPQDRLILRLHFAEGLSVADIARLLSCDQKPLYRRIDGLLRTLREALEREGIEGTEWLDL